MDFAELKKARWSPREFTAQKIDVPTLREIFSASSLAQSSYNEQPWRYLIATKDDGAIREQLESYLVEGNAFAREAWVLGISFAGKVFARNGKPNRAAEHDLGAANQMMALKAHDLGYGTRFMVGFDHERAREVAPKDFEPLAMFVIGVATEKALKAGPGDRGRNPVEEFVYAGQWGKGL